MNGQMISHTTAAAAMVRPMTLPHIFSMAQAPRHVPVRHSPASGTTAIKIAKYPQILRK